VTAGIYPASANCFAPKSGQTSTMPVFITDFCSQVFNTLHTISLQLVPQLTGMGTQAITQFSLIIIQVCRSFRRFYLNVLMLLMLLFLSVLGP
jgi:hypothetical protein